METGLELAFLQILGLDEGLGIDELIRHLACFPLRIRPLLAYLDCEIHVSLVNKISKHQVSEPYPNMGQCFAIRLVWCFLISLLLDSPSLVFQHVVHCCQLWI